MDCDGGVMVRASIIIIIGVALSLSACVGNPMGLARADVPSSHQGLYDRAAAGSKQSQFELGVALAAAPPDQRDCRAARRLLSLAAMDAGGTLWVYSPPVGNGTSGRVIPINTGPRKPGLSTARELLAMPGFCPDHSQAKAPQ